MLAVLCLGGCVVHMVSPEPGLNQKESRFSHPPADLSSSESARLIRFPVKVESCEDQTQSLTSSELSECHFRLRELVQKQSLDRLFLWESPGEPTRGYRVRLVIESHQRRKQKTPLGILKDYSFEGTWKGYLLVEMINNSPKTEKLVWEAPWTWKSRGLAEPSEPSGWPQAQTALWSGLAQVWQSWVRSESARWELRGRVAFVDGSRVYVNLGAHSGLKVGDLLRVVELPVAVYDPQTGRYLGSVSGKLKATIEVMGFIEPDLAITRVQSGGGVQVNDVVELSWSPF